MNNAGTAHRFARLKSPLFFQQTKGTTVRAPDTVQHSFSRIRQLTQLSLFHDFATSHLLISQLQQRSQARPVTYTQSRPRRAFQPPHPRPTPKTQGLKATTHFTMLSVRSSVDSIYSRLSGEKPLPKPAYHCNMNPQEQSLWAIIVSTLLPSALCLKELVLIIFT